MFSTYSLVIRHGSSYYTYFIDSHLILKHDITLSALGWRAACRPLQIFHWAFHHYRLRCFIISTKRRFLFQDKPAMITFFFWWPPISPDMHFSPSFYRAVYFWIDISLIWWCFLKAFILYLRQAYSHLELHTFILTISHAAIFRLSGRRFREALNLSLNCNILLEITSSTRLQPVYRLILFWDTPKSAS